MIQIVATLASLAVLIAYAASQTRWLRHTGLVYILLNLIGSGILAVVAIVERQWGFLLQEGAWTLISLWSALRFVPLMRRRVPGMDAAGDTHTSHRA